MASPEKRDPSPGGSTWARRLSNPNVAAGVRRMSNARRMSQDLVAQLLGDDSGSPMGQSAIKAKALERVAQLKAGLKQGEMGPHQFDAEFTKVWSLTRDTGDGDDGFVTSENRPR